MSNLRQTAEELGLVKKQSRKNRTKCDACGGLCDMVIRVPVDLSESGQGTRTFLCCSEKCVAVIRD